MSLINDALKKAVKEKGPEGPFSGLPGSPESSSPQKMGMKREKIILFSLIGVIGMGIIISVMIVKLHAPSPPSNVPLPSKETPAPAPLPTAPVPSPLPIPEPSPTEAKTVPPPAVESPQSSPIAIKSSLALNGIVQGKGEDVAIINNQITKIGEEIGGATLLEIGRDSVLLEEGEKRFRLKLK